jgi:hypothetical protein
MVGCRAGISTNPLMKGYSWLVPVYGTPHSALFQARKMPFKTFIKDFRIFAQKGKP